MTLVAAAAILAGCATVDPKENAPVTAKAEEVQAAAWMQVEALLPVLERVDAARYPGVAGLAADLRGAAEVVNADGGGWYEAIDPDVLIARSPHFWRANAEMAADDGLLPALEVLVNAAAGRFEMADDLLDMMRAGALMPEELDQALARQRHLIDAWRLGAGGIDVALTRGQPAVQRWEPLKRLQAKDPDSALAAWEILVMRCELAGIELTAEGEDQRMRDKILAAEPQALAALQEARPLWAAVITAQGEAGDAARRVSEALTPDPTGVVNLSADDFAQLAADLERIGRSDWALRALRLRMGRRAGGDEADREAWLQALERTVGPELAAPVVDVVKAGQSGALTAFPAVSEPTGRERYPVDPLVGGHYERLRREGAARLASGTPGALQEANARRLVAESERTLGNLAQARAATDAFAAVSKDRVTVAIQRLKQAMWEGDPAGMEARLQEVRRADRRLTQAGFVVGNAEVALGRWREAAAAFGRLIEDETSTAERRAFAALHAYGAASLAGNASLEDVREARARVDEKEWVSRLLGVVIGDVSREQILIEAAEGRDYLKTGQRCEAHFALAFAPGQTAAGRRADMEEALRTGMVDYMEYGFALAWLRREFPERWAPRPGEDGLLARPPVGRLEEARPRDVR